MKVTLCAEVGEEIRALPPAERVSIAAAFEKLNVYGDQLAPPHSSAVKGVEGTLRELRPRAGRSRWRAFYRRIGDEMVVGAIGSEAQVNPAGFRRAVGLALQRLDAFERERGQ